MLCNNNSNNYPFGGAGFGATSVASFVRTRWKRLLSICCVLILADMWIFESVPLPSAACLVAAERLPLAAFRRRSCDGRDSYKFDRVQAIPRECVLFISIERREKKRKKSGRFLFNFTVSVNGLVDSGVRGCRRPHQRTLNEEIISKGDSSVLREHWVKLKNLLGFSHSAWTHLRRLKWTMLMEVRFTMEYNPYNKCTRWRYLKSNINIGLINILLTVITYAGDNLRLNRWIIPYIELYINRY